MKRVEGYSQVACFRKQIRGRRPHILHVAGRRWTGRWSQLVVVGDSVRIGWISGSATKYREQLAWHVRLFTAVTALEAVESRATHG